MKMNRLTCGSIFICFLVLSVGPMFYGGVNTAFGGEEKMAPAAKSEMKAPMKSEKKHAMTTHKKMGKKMMRSDKIMAVQKALNNSGFKVKEDGFMGKHTRQALMKYQKDNNLKATGKADMETMAKLGIK